uniref:hypothetical protein n=1 Tax=Paenarthrobacter ureafaciens TaxID=37931 RepID=UPI003F499FF3
MTREENYIEHALHIGQELTGLSLQQLGFEPRMEDLSDDELTRLSADDLEWLDTITPEQRDKSLFQAKLLAGVLWEASAVLIDQLFEDLNGLKSLDQVDRHDIANTFVLSGLPPRHADKYDVRFAQQFLVIAADMTASLIRGWATPGWKPPAATPSPQQPTVNPRSTPSPPTTKHCPFQAYPVPPPKR